MGMHEFILFHWSPVARRKSIDRWGLRPGSKSMCGRWKPPYVCFSRSPSMAWGLSPRMHKRGRWDLWMVWSTSIQGAGRLYPQMARVGPRNIECMIECRRAKYGLLVLGRMRLESEAYELRHNRRCLSVL